MPGSGPDDVARSDEPERSDEPGQPDDTREPPPPLPAPAAQGGERHSILVAVLLAASAIVAAAVGARASFVSSSASGGRQQAARIDVKRGAATLEDVRFVYTDEASQAFAAAKASVRREELERAAANLSGDDRTPLALDSAEQRSVLETLTKASELVSSGRYSLEGGGYDLVSRLADVRKESPGIIALDPDAVQRTADRASWKAMLMTLAIIPAALAFLLGTLGQAFVRRRRFFAVAGFASLLAAAVAALVVEVTL